MAGHSELSNPVAGNGILSRRLFLEGTLVVGAAGVSASSALAEPLTVQPWMKVPGTGFYWLRPALALRGQGRQSHSAAAKSGDARRRPVAHAATIARRYHHAVGTSLRAESLWHP